MRLLVAGLVLFLGTHLLTTRRALRAGLIERLGPLRFKGLYSLASLAGFALVIHGFGTYREAGYIDVWTPPRGLAHFAMLLNLPVFVLLATAYLPGGWIKGKTRHPMLLAIKCWALAHLLANGDLGSMLLFGGFLAWAAYARMSMRERGEADPAPVAFGRSDIVAVAGGLAAYAVFALWLHPIAIGVAVAG
ncbi:MAG: NnrU family protein [Rhodospirillales bacterium]|nr:NnrU family protein [Rhodospirillales bacterium]